MKRVVSRQQFEGNSKQALKEFAPDPHDKVTFDILGGTISFVVPPDLGDEEVLQDQWVGRDAYCVLTLENKTELEVWLNEGPPTVVVRKPKSDRSK